MNDELVYALIGLGLHWWLGWVAAKHIKRHEPGEWDNLEGEMILLFRTITVGSFIAAVTFIVYGLAPVVKAWYQQGGRIFGGDDES